MSLLHLLVRAGQYRALLHNTQEFTFTHSNPPSTLVLVLPLLSFLVPFCPPVHFPSTLWFDQCCESVLFTLFLKVH